MGNQENQNGRDPRQAEVERRLSAHLARRDRAALDAASLALGNGLTSAQERMWFLQAMNPESVAYSIATAHWIVGPLSVPVLRVALSALAERHEMMRSSFPSADGRPYRVLHDKVHVEPTILDQSGCPVSEREAIARQEIRRTASKTFDLQTAPLLNVTVVRFSETEHVLIAVFHHIIADGWSLGVFYHDLELAYAAVLQGESPMFGEPPRPAAEAVSSEQAFLASERGSSALDWWVARLSDAPMLELPMARPRPPVTRFMGARHERVLSGGLVSGLEMVARSANASLYMILAAAFAILLHRYSGQEDLVFGSPVANRADPLLERGFGLYVNTVVLRVPLDGACTIREVLGRVRAATLGALQHQGVPFERIVERLSPRRALSHNPIFQVMFALQSGIGHPLRLHGLGVTPMAAGEEVARFDLECSMWRTADGLKVRFVRNADIIDDAAAERLLDHFSNVLVACARSPDQSVSRIDLVGADEAVGLAARERAPAAPGATACLHVLFERQAVRSPDAIALEDGRTKLTFRQLDAWSTRLRGELVRLGVAPGHVVGICTERNVGMVAATLAILKAGAAFLPLDPADPEDRRAFMLSEARVQIVVTSKGSMDIVATSKAMLVDVDAVPAGEALLDPPVFRPTDLAYVIYTSGSTGRPKGVQIEHRNVVNTLCACHDIFRFGPMDRGLVLAASTFDVFYYELFAPLLGGGRSRLVTREEVLDPMRIVPLLREATCFQAVPGMMEHLLAALRCQGVDRCSNMRLVMTGGDLVPPALLQALHDVFPQATVSVTYGPTEAAIFCTYFLSDSDRAFAGHPIGVPLLGAIVRIADEKGRSLPVGVNGEIWIGGAGVGRGYINRPAETTERFVDVDGDRFYRSGDRGRLLPEHGIEFLGRADRQVKVRGFRIELPEIEAVLETTPGVARGLVVVHGTESSDQRLAAYVVPHEPLLLRSAAQLEAPQIENWRDLFESVYASRHRRMAGENDFTGWNCSVTGEPMPLDDMCEWLEATLKQIRSRVPSESLRDRTLQVLEIGCGTGLIVQQLAHHCSRYVGTDFSRRALADLRSKLGKKGLDHVVLHETGADCLGPVGKGFDVVIINSVAQYMPSIARLHELIDDALDRIRPGGFIFLGDIRNLCLLEMFHVAVESKLTPNAPAADILRRARRRMGAEQELVLHPNFVGNGLRNADRIAAIEAEPRRGRLRNELTCYRCDVVLHRKPVPGKALDAHWRNWGAEGWNMTRVRRALVTAGSLPLALTAIPNAMLLDDLQIHAALAGARGEAGPVIPAGDAVFVEDLRQLAQESGVHVRISCLRGCPHGTFDAYFNRTAEGWPKWPVAAADPLTANEPILAAAKRSLVAEVQDFLSRRLPEYMMPSTVTVLDAFQLTSNGKLDRAALPLPEEELDRRFRPPLTEEERLVARAWDEVLGFRQRSTDDDFFASGGTSLRAVQVSSLLRTRGAQVSPQMIFELRTIGRLAASIDCADPSRHSSAASGVPATVSAEAAVLSSTEMSTTFPDLWNNAERILLTGATGMLGIHLLDELLANTPAQIVSLVRSTDDRSALARLQEQYRWYFPDRDTTSFQSRVCVVAGDLRQPRLGLDEDHWLGLARGCDHVLNAAADVRHVGSRDEILLANHEGVRELLALAGAERPSRFLHISTVAVKGDANINGAAADIAECDGKTLALYRSDPYAESKALAEGLVKRHFAAGGRGAILRVGTVAPHSASGRFQRNIDDHFFSRYLRALMELGIACDQPGRGFSLIPADFMARAVRLLCGSGDTPGGVFHLESPHRLSHDSLVAILRAAGYSINLLADDAFARAVARIGRDPRRAAALGRLLPLVDTTGPPAFAACERGGLTQSQLESLGAPYPLPSEDWLRRFIDFGIGLGYFPSPAGGLGAGSSVGVRQA